MAFWNDLGSNFTSFANTYGTKFAAQNLTATFAAGSYDEPAWTASGTKQAGSCIFLPVSTRFGGDDRIFFEKGLLQDKDMKAFLPSGVDINESADVVIDSGSYKIMPRNQGGIVDYPNTTNIVYTKVYLKSLKP